MITLLTAETAKASPISGANVTTIKAAETADSFAAMVGADKPTIAPPGPPAGVVDGDVVGENGLTVVDPDSVLTEDIDSLAAPGVLPEKPSAAGGRPVDALVRNGPVPQWTGEVPSAASTTGRVDQDAERPENVAGRSPDAPPFRGFSSAQSMVEGRNQPAATPLVAALVKPAVDRPAAPVKGDPAAHRTTPEKQVEASIAAATAPRQAIAPDVAAQLPAARPPDQPEHIEKRQDIAAQTAVTVTPAPAQGVSGQMTSQPVAAVQTVVQAAVRERREQDGKSSERELAIGSAIPDRPVAAQSSTTQPTATATTEMARSVTQQLAVAVSQGTDKTTEIALSPAELGRVRLTLTAHDGVLTLAVMAERPETQDLLRRNIEMLAQDFRALGYQDLTFSFGAEGQTSHSGTSDNDNPTTQANVAETDPDPDYGGSHPATGLDLRL